MYELLKLVEENAKYTTKELALLAGISEEETAAAIAKFERDGIIQGYKGIVNWEATPCDYVSAHIELKVIPKKDKGFDELAETIASFPEVESLYLMSGGHDISITVVGESFKDIANFVAYRLAPLDSVQSTATHFVLKRYKEKGVNLLFKKGKDERRMVL